MTLHDTETGEVVELVEFMEADEAREVTDAIRSTVAIAWEKVCDAYVRRAWTALGYATWDDYCSAEFGGVMLALPREERAEVVSSLREKGLSVRAIASATGASVGTVHNDLAGVQNRTPGDVKGTDGSTYSSKAIIAMRERKAREAAERAAAEAAEGSKPREDEGGSDDEGASTDEGAGSPTHDPAPSAPAEKTAEERLHEYRKAWFAEQKRSVDHLFQFDPDELVSVLDATERDVLRSTGNAARAWAERIEKALSPTLKAVN